MKRLVALTLAVLMCCIGAGTPVTANSFAAASDEEYYLFQVAQIMEGYEENPQAAVAALAELDTELIGEPSVQTIRTSGTERRTDPTDYTLKIYCTKRGMAGVNLAYYLSWTLEAEIMEILPGPLDFISIEWDTRYGEYYSSNGDGVYSTVKSRSDGIVLFNLQDNDLRAGNSAQGSVRLSPKAPGNMRYGSKFVHTYTTLNVSGSATVSYGNSAEIFSQGYGSLNLGNTKGFTVNVGTNTSQWEMWIDGRAYIGSDGS